MYCRYSGISSVPRWFWSSGPHSDGGGRTPNEQEVVTLAAVGIACGGGGEGQALQVVLELWAPL